MNNYYKDAGVFLRFASDKIDKNIKYEDIIHISINIALGVERILKGILYDINPTYIYIEPKFDNTAQFLYRGKLKVSKSESLSSKVNEDVITFKNSLYRAECFSETTLKNKGVLFIIENTRDIIAHCELQLLEPNKLKELILRDYFPLIKSYCEELKIPRNHYLNGKHIKLASISSELQNDLQKKIDLLFEVHLEKWKTLKGNIGYVQNKEIETRDVLSHKNKLGIECPCCKNLGILYLEPITEFDQILKTDVIIGRKINQYKCRYCKLLIKDEKLFDKLGFIEYINIREEEEDDSDTFFCLKCQPDDENEYINIVNFSEPYEIKNENIEVFDPNQIKIEFPETEPIVAQLKERKKYKIQSGYCVWCSSKHYRCQECGEIFATNDGNKEEIIECEGCNQLYHISTKENGDVEISIAKENNNLDLNTEE